MYLLSAGTKNVRNINLRIRTDASVYVSATKDVSESVVTQFVKRRSRYIAEAQQQFREFRQYAPQPRHYVSGESFSVLGRSLRLRVEQGKRTIYVPMASISILL